MKTLIGFNSDTLEEFEEYVIKAKDCGATHIAISGDFPPAMWQYEQSGDPYTAWFVIHAGLLKIFPPDKVKPFVDTEYAKSVVAIAQERCAILRKHDLKAQWYSNEPQTLPEAFFVEHPHLRGPRVDQSNRARTAHFAPCVDQEETLELYRDAVKQMLTACPEIEMFNFLTTDCGSGFCWTDGLYPGKNGNTMCIGRPVEDRVAGFMNNLRQAGLEMGTELMINIDPIQPREWMLETLPEPEKIRAKFEPGLSLRGLDKDEKQLFSGNCGHAWFHTFYPIVGIPHPMEFMRSCMASAQTNAEVEAYNITCSENADLLVDLLKKTIEHKPQSEFAMISILRDVAADIGGEEQADDILSVWLSVDKMANYLEVVNFGPLFAMASVLTRWITRPIVPFPEEIPLERREYYRKYILQSKGESQMEDPLDIQAMDMYRGWGAMLIVQQDLHLVLGEIAKVRKTLCKLAANSEGESKKHWETMEKRFDALRCFVNNAKQVVEYQANMDRIKPTLVENPVDENPVLCAQGSWDYEDVINLARAEIDNSIYLKRLIESTDEVLVDMAPNKAEEAILRLGPEFPEQLKIKVDIMNERWQDYKRIFVTPNP